MSFMDCKLSLFPFKAKFIGLALVVLSLPFAYLYFWGGKPEIFNIKTFAVVTTYIETRYFVISQTNCLDELAAIFFIVGITLLSFSKEKYEKEHYELLRTKALVKALYVTLLFWIISFLLVYGLAIFIVSCLIFIIFLLTYNILFRIYLRQDLNAQSKAAN